MLKKGAVQLDTRRRNKPDHRDVRRGFLDRSAACPGAVAGDGICTDIARGRGGGEDGLEVGKRGVPTRDMEREVCARRGFGRGLGADGFRLISLRAWGSAGAVTVRDIMGGGFGGLEVGAGSASGADVLTSAGVGVVVPLASSRGNDLVLRYCDL